MVRINQIKIPYEYGTDEFNILKKKIVCILGVKEEEILSFKISRKSIDAREKPVIYFVYSVDVILKNEMHIKRKKGNNFSFMEEEGYKFIPAERKTKNPPVIVGMGPAGLFCGYFLARAGYNPIILERGKAVEDRNKDVEKFFKSGELNTESNVQFGEGGAGTYSDGKLNTMVKDKNGRNRIVLETFVKFGADEKILYQHKPHIGTDVLAKIVKNMREEIIKCGGSIRFSSKVTDIKVENNHIRAVVLENGDVIEAEQVVFAIGHSARDTFYMLNEKNVGMAPKAFAVGVRVEHPQIMIDKSQYGFDHNESKDGLLGAADYKLTAHTGNGRSVYSFCMCPGGFVVNASSEERMLAVNGMSYSKRDSKNANSAIIVNVTPDDFFNKGPLGGIEFQRQLERAAYKEGKGKIPVQLFGDFIKDRVSDGFQEIESVTRGETCFANLRNIFPDYINEAIGEAMHIFGKKIKGYDREDVVMSGVESRTSSPVRIFRDDDFQCNIKGVYPCGEGAGYAGGITSAAMDGIRVYEAIAKES